MKRYVVGFHFARHGNLVTLIRKDHPEWQAGKLNGVGGEIVDGETSECAMRREFREETGADIDSWKLFATLTDKDKSRFLVDFYWSTIEASVESKTNEEVSRYATQDVIIGDEKTIANLPWMLLMALNDMNGVDNCARFEITEMEWYR